MLACEDLRWECPTALLRGGAAPDAAFGQERAAEALWTALRTSAPRNAFVSARDDGERMAVVSALLAQAVPPPARGSRREARVVVADDLAREGLFGFLEPARGGTPRVRPGAFQRADGGVLVVEVDDLASKPGLWEDFRRALRDRRVLVRPPGSGARAPGPATYAPPVVVPVSVRAVLVGEEDTYGRLFDEEPGFRNVVPVKATLERRTPATPSRVRAVAAFAASVAERERMLPLSTSARATLVEEAVRLAGRRGWISLRLGRVSEWLREADLLARARGASRVEGRDVLLARRRDSDRLGVYERHAFEDVLEGIVLLSTDGAVTGQVNGLAVHDYGNLGKVARITATVGPGREGIVNVEREVALSGASYDKGVHILAGYLTEVLACRRPAAISIRIVFEQSYGHLTGDSATCAEACAVLSALAELPVRQDLAITGSMNQHGEVQAIGGVNEKIEGFHDLCAARGLTGTQGVIVPRSNVPDLMLRPDVVAACRDGRFRVHPIDRVEEGLSLLTGKPAGRGEDGRFARGSAFDLAAKRMDYLSSLAR